MDSAQQEGHDRQFEDEELAGDDDNHLPIEDVSNDRSTGSNFVGWGGWKKKPAASMELVLIGIVLVLILGPTVSLVLLQKFESETEPSSASPTLAPSSSPSSSPSLLPMPKFEEESDFPLNNGQVEIQPIPAWRVHQPLHGTNGGRNFGKNLALSGDGNLLVVVSEEPSGNMSSTTIHSYMFDRASNWSSVGQPMSVPATLSAMDLSRDGKRLVFASSPQTRSTGTGQTRIFEFNHNQNNTTWIQLGSTITTEESPIESLTINRDGGIVAVGTNDTVHVYQLVNDTWTVMGQPLNDDSAAIPLIGRSLAFSGNGQILAVGSNETVQTFLYHETLKTWVALGPTVQEITTGFGTAVALSDNGDTLAVGAPQDSILVQGFVYAYQWNSTAASWSPLGRGINGESSGGVAGRHVRLSADGRSLAFSEQQSVRIQQYRENDEGGQWEDVYLGIEEFHGQVHALGLSDNATMVAVGVATNEGVLTFSSY